MVKKDIVSVNYFFQLSAELNT